MPRELPTDNARHLEHLWQYATVTDLDCGQRPPAVKVRLDDEQSSDWIPFAQPRAGTAYMWMPPQVGEQGVVLSAGGEMETLLFIAGVFVAEHLPDNASEHLTEIKFPNGDTFSHDAQTGVLSIAASKVKIGCDVIVDGDVTADGISLKTHQHKGVTPGKKLTREPV